MSEESSIEMTNEEILKDFAESDYVSFIEYLNDWFYDEEEE